MPSTRPSALILLPEAAYPVHGGGPLRTASILIYLAQNFSLDAVHFRLAADPDPFLAYPPGTFRRTLLLDLPSHSKAFGPRLLRNALRAVRGVSPLVDRFAGHEAAILAFLQGQQYELAWCEHFWTAPYAGVLRPYARRLVLDLHNVESEYFRTAAQASTFPARLVYRQFAEASRRAERKWLPQFQLVLAPSPEDFALAGQLGAPRAACLANTIPDFPERSAYPQDPPADSIAFSGNFAYAPNRAGLAWFVKNVYPKLFLTLPNVRLRVIGREVETVRAPFSHLERVDWVGPVENAVEEIAKSKTAIAPLFFGSGTRLKILEAWAARAAVVSTSLGAQGLGANHGEHLLLADTPADFCQALIELHAQESRREQLAQNAAAYCRAHFTWRSTHELLAKLLS
ncbi:MAG: glycosyltransferase [Bryobacter sp.]|nr:glycosyltransferase [Bryobacter sp.]